MGVHTCLSMYSTFGLLKASMVEAAPWAAVTSRGRRATDTAAEEEAGMRLLGGSDGEASPEAAGRRLPDEPDWPSWRLDG